MDQYITGERIQELCDIYCGLAKDFCHNLRILAQPERHCDLADPPPAVWKNPPLVFCYAHRLREFRRWLNAAASPMILVTHNSDENITDTYADICNHAKVRAMYSQNVLYDHPRLYCLPIGIANSMWSHGNLSVLHHFVRNAPHIVKENDFYFYFGLITNYAERTKCRLELEKAGFVFGSPQPYHTYLASLASYKYAICPAGHGMDSHRLWECLYLGVTPVMLRNTFTEKFSKAFPCLLLDTWSDLDTRKALDEWKPHPPLPALHMDYVRDCLVACKNIWCIHS